MSQRPEIPRSMQADDLVCILINLGERFLRGDRNCEDSLDDGLTPRPGERGFRGSHRGQTVINYDGDVSDWSVRARSPK